tara:strand:- start:52336 stop:52788 length:453 start_codon:yes stop_codon:yes gene_type:complete
MESIVIGIIAGLTTTFIVVVLQKLWTSAIEPWYEERVYKDAKIEGVWEGTYEEIDLKEIVTLKRKAHSISGTIAIIEGPNQGQTFELTGTFKNLILTATYSAEDRESLDRGSYTLMLRQNGKAMEGHSSFYEDDKNEIVTGPCTWRRKGG